MRFFTSKKVKVTILKRMILIQPIKIKNYKKGYNKMWSGEFKTKNAILPMSVNKYGDVFYQDKNIGRIDKSSKIIDWMKAIKRNNKWVESVDESKAELYRLYSMGMKAIAGSAKHKEILKKIKVLRKKLGMNEQWDSKLMGKPLSKGEIAKLKKKLKAPSQ